MQWQSEDTQTAGQQSCCVRVHLDVHFCKLLHMAYLSRMLTTQLHGLPLKRHKYNALTQLSQGYKLELKVKIHYTPESMYISVLLRFKLLQGFLKLPEVMPKNSKDGTMDSLIYPPYSRSELDSCALAISIALENQEKNALRFHIPTTSSDVSIYHEFHRNLE